MDLTNPVNWFTIKQGKFTANITAQGGSGPGSLIYFDPIPPFEFECSGSILSVLVTVEGVSPDANWVRAGWLNGFLKFPTGKNRIYSQKLLLWEPNLIVLPSYGVYPYTIRVAFPKHFDNANFVCSQFNTTNLDFFVRDPGLQSYLEGQDVLLVNRTILQQLPNGNWVTEFVESVKFARYEARYYTGLDESVLVQPPVFDTEPRSFKARFYSTVPINVAQVTVKMGV